MRMIRARLENKAVYKCVFGICIAIVVGTDTNVIFELKQSVCSHVNVHSKWEI